MSKMNKKIVLSVLGAIILTSTSALAVDFNSIIIENSRAQTDLHFKIKETVKDSKLAAELSQGAKAKYIADHKETIFVKTSKEFLTYAKEKKQFKPSGQQANKRLAEEFKDLE